MPFKVAIAGLGRKGMHHLERLSLRDDFQVVAVHDLSPSRARTAEHLCGRFVADWNALLADSSFETLFIATPPETRARLVCEALAAGKHVAVESPLCFSRQSAEDIRLAAKSSGRLLSILAAGRFDPDFEPLHRAVASGTLGRVRAAKRVLWLNVAARKQDTTPPLPSPEFPPALVEPVTGFLEQLLALVDQPLRSVYATCPAAPNEFMDARALAVRLMFENATSELDIDLASSVPFRTGWVISGTDAGYRKLRTFKRAAGGEIFDVPLPPAESSGGAIYDNLANWLNNAAPPPVEERCACEWMACALLDAVRRSATTGTVIELNQAVSTA